MPSRYGVSMETRLTHAVPTSIAGAAGRPRACPWLHTRRRAVTMAAAIDGAQ